MLGGRLGPIGGGNADAADPLALRRTGASGCGADIQAQKRRRSEVDDLPAINRAGEPTSVETFGRHDPCVGIRATPIAEAMLALVVMDHVLQHRAQCGDVVPPLKPIAGQARKD